MSNGTSQDAITKVDGTEDAVVLRDKGESGLRVLVSSQIDRAIATAHAYPRSVKRCIDLTEAMAIRTPETAAACRYKKPVGGGKFAEGGSIRLAEIAAVCWGNLRIEPPAVEIGERHVEAHVLCQDLESNVTFSGSCSKAITYSKKGARAGQRFGDDQIAVTVAAAIATAKRNAILVTIPRVFWEPILAKCKGVVIGEIRDLKSSVRSMLGHFKTMGINEPRVLASISRRSVEDIIPDDVADLRSTAAAIASGDLSVAEAFPGPEAAPATKPAPHAAVDAALDELGAVAPAPEPAPAASDGHGTGMPDGPNAAVITSGDPTIPGGPAAPESPAQAATATPAASEQPIGQDGDLYKKIKNRFDTLTDKQRVDIRRELTIASIRTVGTWNELDANDALKAIEAKLAETAT